jgi:RHS repeat-associated protein
MLRSATTSYYQADGLGTITSLSSGAGALAQTYAFDSFGNQTASSGSLTNPFQYTGREFDPETSLYYYRARYYDPQAGRFTSEDPIRFGSGGTNFYAYVQNEATSLGDPLGLSPQQTKPCGPPHICVGRARVIGGNPKTVGKQGGVPGRTVAPNSAAATPQQWGFTSGSGFRNFPVAGTVGAPISGYLANFVFGDINPNPGGTQQNFNGITDVNGGASPIAGMNVRDALMYLNPGKLVLELVTGQDQGVTTVILALPNGVPCPAGTIDPSLLGYHSTPFF